MKITTENLLTAEKLELIGNASFDLVNAGDITALSADLSTTPNGAADGLIITNARAFPRTIPFILRIKNGQNVQDVIDSVFSVVRLKSDVRITLEGFYKNPFSEVYNDGIITEINKPRFSENSPALSIAFSVYFPDPFWRKNIEETTSNPTEANPYTLTNSGQVETGAEITITATSNAVSIPTVYLASGGNTQTMSFSVPEISLSMDSGDTFVIKTFRGEKSAILTVGGTKTDATPYLDFSADWITIPRGNSSFYLSASNFSVDIKFEAKYI